MAVHARKAPAAREAIRLEDVHQRATLCFSPVGGSKHGILYEAEPTGDSEIGTFSRNPRRVPCGDD